jgi:hypothetical protein
MPPVPRPTLQLLRGARLLREVEVLPDKPLTLGRTGGCDVEIGHPSVSRVHAKINADSAGVYIEDLGSANGTFVDGHKLTAVTRLKHGDVVQLGQRAEQEPIVLRFDDPATRLLQEMGLIADPAAERGGDPRATSPGPLPREEVAAAGPPTPPPAAPAAADAATGPPPAPGPGEAATGGEGDAAEAGGGEALEEPPPPPPRAAWFKRPAVLAGIAAALVFFVVGVLLLLRALRPEATVWRTVQLSTTQVAAGTELGLRSPDIQPGAAVAVTLGGEPVPRVEVEPGALAIVVPALPSRPAGYHELPLQVRAGERLAFEAVVQYVVQPRITAIEPGQTAVGQLVTLVGSGFPNVAAAVEVRLGDQLAAVDELKPGRIRVRVPMLTRDAPVQVTVRLRTGEMEATAPGMLVVAPRQPEPIPFILATTYRPAQRVWEVRHPLGLLFLFPGEHSLPPQLQRLQLAARQLFEAAAADPELEVRPRSSGGRFALVAEGRGDTLPLMEWSESELAAAVPQRQGEVAPDMIGHYMAGVWNHFLRALGRGETIDDPRAPAYAAALNKLVAANRAAGGDGRPEEQDLGALSGDDRRLLETAFVALPAGFGRVEGSWRARLENLFAAAEGVEVVLLFDLDQRGRAVSGRARVLFTGEGMEWGIPGSRISGSVAGGMPARVHLEAEFNRPVGRLVLDGRFEEGGFAGTFRSSAAQGTGSWTARRD